MKSCYVEFQRSLNFWQLVLVVLGMFADYRIIFLCYLFLCFCSLNLGLHLRVVIKSLTFLFPTSDLFCFGSHKFVCQLVERICFYVNRIPHSWLVKSYHNWRVVQCVLIYVNHLWEMNGWNPLNTFLKKGSIGGFWSLSRTNSRQKQAQLALKKRFQVVTGSKNAQLFWANMMKRCLQKAPDQESRSFSEPIFGFWRSLFFTVIGISKLPLLQSLPGRSSK